MGAPALPTGGEVRLDDRFETLTPKDFAERARFISAQPPPIGFRQCWGALPRTDFQQFVVLFPQDDLSCLIAMSDPCDAGQNRALFTLLEAIRLVAGRPMCVVWAPHRGAQERLACVEKQSVDSIAKKAIGLGCAAVVPEGSRGLAFALQVRAAWRKHTWMLENTPPALARRIRKLERFAVLDQSIDEAVWDFYVSRCLPLLPAMDSDIEVGDILFPEGFEMGQVLLHAAPDISWFILTDDETGVVQALKAQYKYNMLDLEDVRRCHHEIEILTYLSEWAHPGIARLHQVYHAPLAIYFRMSFGGIETLRQRLLDREAGAGRRRLPTVKAMAILRQLFAAVAFLHSVPKVCHRDIKSSCIVIYDVLGAISVQLRDFDAAWRCSGDRPWCASHTRGTYPWVAPEALLSLPYNGFAADVWSEGIVMLDILCSIHTADSLIQGRGLGKLAACRAIRNAFSSISRTESILHSYAHPELKCLATTVIRWIGCVLNLDPKRRWDAERALRAIAGELAEVHV